MLIHPVRLFDRHLALNMRIVTKKRFLRRLLVITAISMTSLLIINSLLYPEPSLDEQLKEFQGAPTVRLFVGVL